MHPHDAFCRRIETLDEVSAAILGDAVAENVKLRCAAVFCRIRLQRFVGLSLDLVSLELSIEIVELAELLENPIDLCHLLAPLYQPDPASSPSSS